MIVIPGIVVVVEFGVEWGGFFDHVAPPRVVAPNRIDNDVDQSGNVLLGFRVPVVIASPWTLGNPATPRLITQSTLGIPFDHTSILKLIEWRFGLQPLKARDRLQREQVGWSKAAELAKVARREREHFESALWLHKAREMPQVEFKHEVEKHLTGKDTEPYELVTFKLYKGQLPVVEQALETAGLMLGSDKSRGYYLEMICADFLAGADAEDESPQTLLLSVLRLVRLLPAPEMRELAEAVGAAA